MKIITRRQAMSQGLLFYTGKPCKYNHVSERYASNGQCLACLRETYRPRLTPEKRLENKRQCDANHYAKNQQRIKRTVKAYKTANPKKVLALCAKRKADKIKRTPKWSEAKAISEFYEACPNGFHVDHIIPLKGDIASGLHVLSNLQYLTPIGNLSKKNRVPRQFTLVADTV